MHHHLLIALLGIVIYTLGVCVAIFWGWVMGHSRGMERRWVTPFYALGGLLVPVLGSFLGSHYDSNTRYALLGFFLMQGVACDITSHFRSLRSKAINLSFRDARSNFAKRR